MAASGHSRWACQMAHFLIQRQPYCVILIGPNYTYYTNFGHRAKGVIWSSLYVDHYKYNFFLEFILGQLWIVLRHDKCLLSMWSSAQQLLVFSFEEFWIFGPVEIALGIWQQNCFCLYHRPIPNSKTKTVLIDFKCTLVHGGYFLKKEDKAYRSLEFMVQVSWFFRFWL